MNDQITGQISIFDLVETDWLAEALRGGGYDGFRLRLFAALTYPAFQQYAENFLAREYGADTYHGRSGKDGRFYEFRRDGVHVRILREHTETRYTWKQAVEKARELIEEDGWLSRDEERTVDELMRTLGRLPYPRACMAYPENAWGSREDCEAEIKRKKARQ